jgi:hypothetical protein
LDKSLLFFILRRSDNSRISSLWGMNDVEQQPVLTTLRLDEQLRINEQVIIELGLSS